MPAKFPAGMDDQDGRRPASVRRRAERTPARFWLTITEETIKPLYLLGGDQRIVGLRIRCASIRVRRGKPALFHTLGLIGALECRRCCYSQILALRIIKSPNSST